MENLFEILKNDFSEITPINESKISKIYKAYNNKSKRYSCLKIINKKELEEGDYDFLLEQINREEEVTKLCNSENIVKLYQKIEIEDNIIFEIELCDMDLGEYIKTNGCLEKDIKFYENIIIQLTESLKTIYEKGVIHRDIKPNNIFIKKENERKIIKLGDFGCSIFKKDNDFEQIGTITYNAPEIIKNLKYDEKCDLWSLGITLYELYFGVLPYGNNPTVNSIKKTIIKGQNLILKKSNNEIIDNLFKKLLTINPDERITFDEFFAYIKNNFYNEINIKNIMNIHFDKDGKKITIQAQPEEMFSEIVIKYLKKLGIYDLNPILYYYYNSKLLNLFETINENQIMNNSIIFVTENPNYFNYISRENFYNDNAPISFGNQSFPMNNMCCASPNLNDNYGYPLEITFTFVGRNINIQDFSNTKFCKLVDKFKTKANLTSGDMPIFFFNSQQIMENDQRTISELNIKNQSRIYVFQYKTEECPPVNDKENELEFNNNSPEIYQNKNLNTINELTRHKDKDILEINKQNEKMEKIDFHNKEIGESMKPNFFQNNECQNDDEKENENQRIKERNNINRIKIFAQNETLLDIMNISDGNSNLEQKCNNIIYYNDNLNYLNLIKEDSDYFEENTPGAYILCTNIESFKLIINEISKKYKKNKKIYFNLIVRGNQFLKIINFLTSNNNYETCIKNICIYCSNEDKYLDLKQKYNILHDDIYTERDKITINFINKYSSTKIKPFPLTKLITFQNYKVKYKDKHFKISQFYGDLNPYSYKKYIKDIESIIKEDAKENKLYENEKTVFDGFLTFDLEKDLEILDNLIIKEYTKNSFYGDLNKWLMNSKIKSYQPIAYFTSRLMYSLNKYASYNNMYFTENKPLYRGVKLEYSNLFPYERAKGKIIIFSAFTSSSESKEFAEKWCQRGESKELYETSLKFSVLFIIKNNYKKNWISNGINIQNESEYDDEEEILFQPFSFYYVQDVKIDYNNYTADIYLETVGKKEILEDQIKFGKEIKYNEDDNIMEIKPKEEKYCLNRIKPNEIKEELKGQNNLSLTSNSLPQEEKITNMEIKPKEEKYCLNRIELNEIKEELKGQNNLSLTSNSLPQNEKITNTEIKPKEEKHCLNRIKPNEIKEELKGQNNLSLTSNSLPQKEKIINKDNKLIERKNNLIILREKYDKIIDSLKRNKKNILSGDYTENDWENGLCEEKNEPKIYTCYYNLREYGKYFSRRKIKLIKEYKDIIVGWKIKDLWRDGTNGCWELKENPILKKKIEIIFTSQLFRGEHFEVKIYLMKYPE